MANRSSVSDNLDKFLVRMPPGMRDQIAERARKNRRTMTAEVMELLEEGLRRDAVNHASGVREEPPQPGRLIRLAEVSEPDAPPAGQAPEEEALLRSYRRLPYGARTPIQALVQALASQLP